MSNVNNPQEEDVVEKFRTAVYNGQTRLALEALVDIVDGILGILFPDEEQQQQQVEQVKVEEQKVAAVAVEDKPAAKKKAKETKEETLTVSAE